MFVQLFQLSLRSQLDSSSGPDPTCPHDPGDADATGVYAAAARPRPRLLVVPRQLPGTCRAPPHRHDFGARLAFNNALPCQIIFFFVVVMLMVEDGPRTVHRGDGYDDPKDSSASRSRRYDNGPREYPGFASFDIEMCSSTHGRGSRASKIGACLMVSKTASPNSKTDST